MLVDGRCKKNMNGRILLPLIAAALSACALEPSVPESYQGPTAVLSDTHVPESGSKAQFFVLESIDGKQVNNSLIESRKASSGAGLTLYAKSLTREIPVRPLKLKLLATHATGAPIHALFSLATGGFQAVEGEVSFVPKEHGQYIVTGVLSQEGSAVWIQDLETNQPVTEKIVSRESARSGLGGTSERRQPPPASRVSCDKWGNPKDEHGNPCQ